MEEQVLSADMRRVIEDIALAISVGPAAMMAHDDRMKPEDDVLLYEIGFRHEMSADVLWRKFPSGSSIQAELDKGQFIVFSYEPPFDIKDVSTHRRVRIGTARYSKLKELIEEFDNL